jgi:hypothetical protein
MWLRPRILDCDSAQLLPATAHPLQKIALDRLVTCAESRLAALWTNHNLTGGPLHTLDLEHDPDLELEHDLEAGAPPTTRR